MKLKHRPHLHRLKDEIASFDSKKVDQNAEDSLTEASHKYFGTNAKAKAKEEKENDFLVPTFTPQKTKPEAKGLTPSPVHASSPQPPAEIMMKKLAPFKLEEVQKSPPKKLNQPPPPPYPRILRAQKKITPKKQEQKEEEKEEVHRHPPKIALGLMDAIKNPKPLKKVVIEETIPIENTRGLANDPAVQAILDRRKKIEPDEGEDSGDNSGWSTNDDEGGRRKKKQVKKKQVKKKQVKKNIPKKSKNTKIK